MTVTINARLDPIEAKQALVELLLTRVDPITRRSWQSIDAPSSVRELSNVVLEFDVPSSAGFWVNRCYPYPLHESADARWAEEHHKERVSGDPLNPAPSYERWPWHSEAAREQFKQRPREVLTEPAGYSADLQSFGRKIVGVREQPFDHTYPERMWPKYAVDRRSPYGNEKGTRRGIRFAYGDLLSVVHLLHKDPDTRQAYLPIWFPEDTGSEHGQRVPCTLGYHFIRNGNKLDVNYFIRSCDITRHFTNDVYMTGRLLQWVWYKLQELDDQEVTVGTLTMFASNLHMFTADEWRHH
ncbi:thymidylate synthase [Gordonia phage Margaret]|nr:thymidylate synthase [Gordonia phage Margaret]